jgi:hypothetical protein
MKAFTSPLKRLKKPSGILKLILLISVFLFSFTDGIEDIPVVISDDNEVENTTYHLNLRIHIMSDIKMVHSSGLVMESWVTPKDVANIIMPEVNAIWKQANIEWVIESIIVEDVVKTDKYAESIAFIAGTKRDSEGHSDPARLPHLYSLMQPKRMSKADELDQNLFHIYLFPFIGNTSQGNAMRRFNWSTVVGTWTNKFNRGGTPEKTALLEDHDAFKRGSLSRTIAHEIGHVLTLRHKVCKSNCLMGGRSQGYLLSEEQIKRARLAASKRL